MHSNRSSSIVDTAAVAVFGLAFLWRRYTPIVNNPRRFWRIAGFISSHRRFEQVAMVTGHVMPIAIPEESQQDFACRSLHLHLLRFWGRGVAPPHALLLSFWLVEVYPTLIPSDDTLQKCFTISLIPTQKILASIDMPLFHFRCQSLGYHLAHTFRNFGSS